MPSWQVGSKSPYADHYPLVLLKDILSLRLTAGFVRKDKEGHAIKSRAAACCNVSSLN